jgi:hypothetical protein
MKAAHPAFSNTEDIFAECDYLADRRRVENRRFKVGFLAPPTVVGKASSQGTLI